VRPNVLRGGPRIATNSSARMSKRDGAGLLLPDARASVVLSRAACAYRTDRRNADRVPMAEDWQPCRFNGIFCRRYRRHIGGEPAFERQDSIGDWATKAQVIHVSSHEFPVVRGWGTSSRIRDIAWRLFGGRHAVGRARRAV